MTPAEDPWGAYEGPLLPSKRPLKLFEGRLTAPEDRCGWTPVTDRLRPSDGHFAPTEGPLTLAGGPLTPDKGPLRPSEVRLTLAEGLLRPNEGPLRPYKGSLRLLRAA